MPLSIRFKLITVLAVSAIFSQIAAASSGVFNGGGGTFAVDNGQVKISDEYYKSMGKVQPSVIRPASYDDLPQPVRSEIERLFKLMENLGARPWGDEMSLMDRTLMEIKDSEFGKARVYMLVPPQAEALANQMCDQYLPELQRPLRQYRFGCTAGDTTYLFVKKLETGDVRQQALAILHERLWTVGSDPKQADIAAFIGSLDQIDQLQKQQLKGQLSELTHSELQLFEKFTQAARNLSFGITVCDGADQKCTRTPQGGLIVFRQALSGELSLANSRIEIGGQVWVRRPTVIKNSLIINSIVDPAVSGRLAIMNSDIINDQTSSSNR